LDIIPVRYLQFMRLDRFHTLLVLMGLLFASCEKSETPVKLPPAGSAQQTKIDLGEDYEDQIFFDFETGKEVMMSKVSSWDLAFEASADGYHVFINGGRNIFINHTNSFVPSSVTSADQVSPEQWQADASCGLPDSTCIGEWVDSYGASKNEVYIVKIDPVTFMKLVLVSVDHNEYVIKYGDIGATELTTLTIPKDNQFNFTYFSFSDGGKIVSPEPPKDTWDIVFTRYRIVYYDLNNFPYLVSGVLLNPNNTTASADSVLGFDTLTYNNGYAFSNHRDVIGFDWKMYNFTSGRYEVKPNKCYLVKTRKNQYWKIHFLGFYSNAGLKGSPSFEFERVL
jgi:hypothetical protein